MLLRNGALSVFGEYAPAVRLYFEQVLKFRAVMVDTGHRAYLTRVILPCRDPTFSASGTLGPLATSLTPLSSPAGFNFAAATGSPPTPGKVSVAIPPNITTPYTVELGGLTNGVNTGASCTNLTNGVLELSNGDPSAPKFYVHTWVLGVGNGTSVVSPVAPVIGPAAPGSEIAKATVTPSFSPGPSEFLIGATISTDCSLDGTYSDSAPYVGNLTIEVYY